VSTATTGFSSDFTTNTAVGSEALTADDRLLTLNESTGALPGKRIA